MFDSFITVALILKSASAVGTSIYLGVSMFEVATDVP